MSEKNLQRDQVNDEQNRLKLRCSRGLAASGRGLRISNYGVTDAGRYPLADGNGCQDDEQNGGDLIPGERVERSLELETQAAGADQPETVDSRMLMSQRNTEMPAKAGITCGTMAWSST